jgi:hypothetical protein
MYRLLPIYASKTFSYRLDIGTACGENPVIEYLLLYKIIRYDVFIGRFLEAWESSRDLLPSNSQELPQVRSSVSTYRPSS